MTQLIEKYRKYIFILILAVAMLMIYVYNLLTPYLSDDYFYAFEVRQASSLWDLVKQQYGEYLKNSGRVIGQFNIRLALSVDKHVFNVVNTGMFGVLVLLIYQNIRRRKKHDILLLLLIVLFLWRYAVSFGQTMLWICGSCNYLWGSVFILGFVTFFRHLLEQVDKMKHPMLVSIGAFFFGVLAGWCNENTSGGGLLLVLLFTVNFMIDRKKAGSRKVYPFMITGVAGMCCGLLGMIAAPGVRNRSATMAEGEYTGIVGLLSRIYKTTMTVRELFFELLIILVIALVFLAVQQKLKRWQQIRSHESVLFLVAAAATAYVLAVIPTTADRAFFGAGIFLMIAVLQGITDIDVDKEMILKSVKYSLAGVLCLWLFFTYMENLVNLARIYREENERVEMIKADKADPEGDGIVIVPKLREEFANPYSNAHLSDMTEDKNYWINIFYEIYYDVGNITAIPRDEWEELYADTFGQPK